MLLGALIAAAVIRPPSEYRVEKISEEERRITAVHESGHAILAAALPAGGAITEITIVSRWGVLGSVTRAPAPDGLGGAALRARKMAELVIAQGGLIAEQLILDSDDNSEAMTSDIKAAEKIAFELLGGQAANLSAEEAEAGVRRLMDEAERQARALLGARQAALRRLAEMVLQHGALSGAEVAVILGGGKLDKKRS
jgi:cell division protease FtsH